mgnify:CR=1 FL=1
MIQKRKNYSLPTLELRKNIENLEKKQMTKVHEDLNSKRKKNPAFYEKKLAMLFGYEKMKEIISKYRLLNKI